MKLFTIGDSISQGFMSGGAAKPELSFGARLAEAIGDNKYTYLPWTPKHHLKVDLELILRKIEKKFGANIKGLEWSAVLWTINSVLDAAEEYFEEGEGQLGNRVVGKKRWFHSVAVEGMDVGDSWLVTPKLCREVVEADNNEDAKKDNRLFGIASDSFYRNAYRVLNPQGRDTEAEYGDRCVLDWLDAHCKREEGIANTTIWLGANNALRTVIELCIKQTSGDGSVSKMSREKRQEFNLWHPNDFDLEYNQMMDRVDESMRENRNDKWRVFVGTIPYVTIAPVVKGVGEPREVAEVINGETHKALYFQYYTYFPLNLDNALRLGKYLKFRDARFIDRSIAAFNVAIKDCVKRLNEKHGGIKRYHVVDIADALRQMAWKRNKGMPVYKFPKALEFHYPMVDTKYYHATRDGRVEKGGIFSLDGVHPSTVGQGIIAHEFLEIMKQSGGIVGVDAEINWSNILESDQLLRKPIGLMSEIYEHEKLLDFVSRVIQNIRR